MLISSPRARRNSVPGIEQPACGQNADSLAYHRAAYPEGLRKITLRRQARSHHQSAGQDLCFDRLHDLIDQSILAANHLEACFRFLLNRGGHKLCSHG
jgi:hypothetical protein